MPTTILLTAENFVILILMHDDDCGEDSLDLAYSKPSGMLGTRVPHTPP